MFLAICIVLIPVQGQFLVSWWPDLKTTWACARSRVAGNSSQAMAVLGRQVHATNKVNNYSNPYQVEWLVLGILKGYIFFSLALLNFWGHV